MVEISDAELARYARKIFGPPPSPADLKALRSDLEKMQTMSPTERRRLIADRVWCRNLYLHPRFEDLSSGQSLYFRHAEATRIAPRGFCRTFDFRPKYR